MISTSNGSPARSRHFATSQLIRAALKATLKHVSPAYSMHLTARTIEAGPLRCWRIFTPGPTAKTGLQATCSRQTASATQLLHGFQMTPSSRLCRDPCTGVKAAAICFFSRSLRRYGTPFSTTFLSSPEMILIVLQRRETFPGDRPLLYPNSSLRCPRSSCPLRLVLFDPAPA